MKLIRTGPIDVEGILVFDPELHFTSSGKAVANIIVRNLEGDEIHCTFWEDNAESIAEDGRRNMSIIVHGEWAYRKFEDRNGNEHIINYVNARQWEWNSAA